MTQTVKKYIEGLEKAYADINEREQWEEFVGVKQGASDEDLARLKALFPEAPQSLLELLGYADGTYHRMYGDTMISLYFLGSALEEYPYFLLSSEEMTEDKALAQEWYSDYIDRKFDPTDIPIDDRVIDNSAKMKWLHFADCMNNGGTSQLFIDFSPSESGKSGQVVMFVHDPDSIEVIADSFDEYLEGLISGGFDFILAEDCGDY